MYSGEADTARIKGFISFLDHGTVPYLTHLKTARYVCANMFCVGSGGLKYPLKRHAALINRRARHVGWRLLLGYASPKAATYSSY